MRCTVAGAIYKHMSKDDPSQLGQEVLDLTVESIDGATKEEILSKYIRVLQYRLNLMYEDRGE